MKENEVRNNSQVSIGSFEENMVTQKTDEIKMGSANDAKRIVKEYKDIQITGVTDQYGSSALPVSFFNQGKDKLDM